MSAFNPVDYLYLNPELVAYMNVLSIEQAKTYYDTNPGIHIPVNISVIPSSFDAEVFLASSKDVANMSSLSRDIVFAMSNQGLSSGQIAKKQKYVPNLYCTAQYTGANTFSVAGTTLNSNNLSVKDSIKIHDERSVEMFFTVDSLTANTFTVSSNHSTPGLYATSNYLLYGINVTDYDRIARINYARIIGGYSNVDQYGTIVSALPVLNTNYLSDIGNSNFNALLYRALYPDSRALDDKDTYLDWVSKRKNEIYRIVNVDDIAFGNGNQYVNMNYLQISCNLMLTGTSIKGVTTFLDPELSNLVGDSNELITANAIKYYTDNRLTALQNQGTFEDAEIDNLIVNNISTLCNIVDVQGDLTVRNSMMLTGGNATFSNGAIINGSLSVTGNVYNARIGLGYMGSYLNTSDGINIINAQNYNDNSDERIKTNISPVITKRCLDIISNLDVCTFSYNYGHEETDNKTTTGLIAQDLLKRGYDDYLYYTKGYVPNIMRPGSLDGNYLYVQTDVELMISRKVKIIVDDADTFVTIVKRMEKGVYMISPATTFTTNKECVVYGYEDDKLLNVDYKQLFVLALGAIKELKQMISISKV